MDVAFVLLVIIFLTIIPLGVIKFVEIIEGVEIIRTKGCDLRKEIRALRREIEYLKGKLNN